MPSSKQLRCFSLALLLSFSRLASGQAATGTPPFGSFGGGGFDTVNLANLNVHFAIPILSKPGRGLPFHYLMDYESSIWAPTTVGSSVLWQPVNTTWGWAAQSEALSGTVPILATTLDCWVTDPNSGLRYKYHYAATDYTGYKDPSGTFHAAKVVTTNGYTGCDNYPTFGQAIHTGSAGASDGSGYLVTVNEQGSPVVQVQTRSGWTIPNPGTSTGTVIDTNGNELTTAVNGTTTTFTDTLGTTVLTVSVPSSSTATYSYTAPSGATAQYTFNYTQKTVQTNFGCSGVGEYPATLVYLLTSVTLPDSTSYSLTYEQTPGKATGIVTGRIASVTLPTGGQISYAYSGGSNGITCADGSTATLVRTTPDGTWTYAHTEGSQWNTTITDAAGNQTSVLFQGIYETQRTVNQKISGVQTLQSTSVTCYNGNTTNCNTTAITLPITQRTMTLQLPNSAGLQSKTDVFLNSLGLPTETDQYGYGSGAPGSLLRKTLITYNTSLTNHILDRPASVIVQDGSANVIGKTTYGYDETAVSQNSGTPPQHVGITGSRGNLTTVSSFSNSTASLSRTTSYYDTGTVNVATDVNGAQTTYGYSSTSCGYSFPDSVTLPLSLTGSTTYNCTGGVATSFTDANGKIIYANYASDAFFWRPNSTQDAAGNTTNITYTGATQAESAMTFNGGNSTADVLATLDSQGRPLYTQRKQSPSSSNYDSSQRTYDVVDMLVKGTMPYVGTAGQSSPQGTPVTTTNYDALGRPWLITDGGSGTATVTYTKNDVLQVIGPAPAGEHTKQKQLEYDALGRLASVCEITSGTGSGACGQTVSQTGFLTTYAYDTTTVNSVLYNRTTVTQNAQPGGTAQTRTFLYDLLGRLVSEANPENGTTAYVYDSDSACASGTYLTGNLVKRTDAVGNVTCYSYDQLHRVLNITYPSGSYAASTPKKYLVYDGATVNGSAMSNPKGRLAEAYTCTGSCTSKITDLGFSYSARGEVTDVYESTPHSSGYYHLTASYFPHGALNALSGVPGLPTIYYGGNNDTSGLDGEGRYLKVTASTGTNPATSVTYTNSGTTQPIGSLTQVTLGSGDSDAFSYDPNTGRMNQYQFNVGSQSVTGVLTWNANGSLGTLGITDQVVTANSQTCNYSHDDLARIASVNCGTAWSQTFGPDALGNLTKSGNSSFLPTYSLATNRFLTVPGGTPTYDNNGNLTNDLSHTYSWDAEGKALAIDTVNLTYDALGRMVEQTRGSSYTQIVYSPTGSKLALMNGQASLQKAFVALPGGATAVYTASGLAYYRHPDWLGSSRLASTPTRTKYYDVAYGPYGESYVGSGTTDLNFTGQNQDTVSGLYDFLYREYHPVQGRWISPDPAGLAAVNPANPQTWNRYAYVANSPLNAIDLFGLNGQHVSSIPDDFFGGSCTVNGMATPCSTAGGVIAAGGGAQCPNNVCEGVDTNGNFAQYACFAGGTCGYFDNSDIAQGVWELNGMLFAEEGYDKYIQSNYADQIEMQREALARAIAANSGGTISYQDAYNSLTVEGGHLQGGNYNFVSTIYDSGDLSCGTDASRCNGVHFPGQDDNGNWFVHLDTSNPFTGPVGFLEHGFVDVFLGNIAYTVIPRPWP